MVPSRHDRKIVDVKSQLKPKINFLFKTWTNVVSLSTLYKLCAPQFKSYFYTKILSNEIGASILRWEKINLLFIIFESNYKFQILLSNREIIIVLIIKYFLNKNMPKITPKNNTSSVTEML